MKILVERLVLLCMLAPIALPAAAQPVKMGFINMPRIERESKRPQRDAENLKREFATREQAVRDLHGKVTAMQKQLEGLKPDTSADEINRRRRELAVVAQQFEQMRRDFVEDVERRKAEERGKFLRDLAAVAARVAKARGIDIVLAEAVYASSAIDITDAVLKGLDQQGGGAK